jgi:hypothetical protein
VNFKPPGLITKISESNLLQKTKKVEKPLKNSESPKNLKNEKNENSSQTKDELDFLLIQLEKTELEMARQQLKISLRKKALYK